MLLDQWGLPPVPALERLLRQAEVVREELADWRLGPRAAAWPDVGDEPESGGAVNVAKGS